jgi:small subunit ribosomal protein S12
MNPTIHQLARNVRLRRHRRCRVLRLYGNPQKKGVVLKIAVKSPRKPNSAQRKYLKVRPINKKLQRVKRAFVHLPGGDRHILHQYSMVLFEGKGPKDVPGVNYTLVPAKYDFLRPSDRTHRRSKFGIKN